MHLLGPPARLTIFFLEVRWKQMNSSSQSLRISSTLQIYGRQAFDNSLMRKIKLALNI